MNKEAIVRGYVPATLGIETLGCNPHSWTALIKVLGNLTIVSSSIWTLRELLLVYRA